MSREKLYALAALLWFVAGVNVLRIGLLGWPTEKHLLGSSLWAVGSSLWAVGSLLFFAGFIFPRVVRRNLTSLTQRSEVALRWYHCFTPSSWIIMCVMITLGVTIRMLELAPPTFITGFYTGLGLSLILSIHPYLREIILMRR